MPLFREIQLDAETKLGIWEIKEEASDLKWELRWGQEDIKQFAAFANAHQRGMHWLASRVLLRRMLNTDKFIDLGRDEDGKPVLNNFPQKLSISHSGDRVAVMLSNRECGADIELMKPNVEIVAKKFISEEEWNCLGVDMRQEQIYIFWCAKEALYKMYGKRKIDFRKNLYLFPFEWQPQGIIHARIEKGSFQRELPVHFEQEDNYMLTYVADNE